MDWTITLVAEPRHVRIVTVGEFTVSDHLRMIDAVLGQPYWTPGTATLFDHRGLSMAGATFSVMEEAGRNHLRHDARIGAGKTAVVMATPADFGSARQFEMIVEGKTATRLRVFLDCPAALEWLAE